MESDKLLLRSLQELKHLRSIHYTRTSVDELVDDIEMYLEEFTDLLADEEPSEYPSSDVASKNYVEETLRTANRHPGGNNEADLTYFSDRLLVSQPVPQQYYDQPQQATMYGGINNRDYAALYPETITQFTAPVETNHNSGYLREGWGNQELRAGPINTITGFVAQQSNKPAVATPLPGKIRINPVTFEPEQYDGVSWIRIRPL